MAIAKFDLAAWQEFMQRIEPSGYQATQWSTQPADASAPVLPLPATAGQTQYIDMESLQGGEKPGDIAQAPTGLAVQSSSQDISAKHFLKAAGFFRGCAVTVVNCEQSVGCHFLSFIPLGLSALHAPSVATSKASTLST